MKRLLVSMALLSSVVLGTTQLTACKSKEKENTNSTTTTTTESTAPVQVSDDATLEQGVKDATKDYPTVTATVSNGEINLIGDVTRDRLPRLMSSLNSLHPKKVNNNLTVK